MTWTYDRVLAVWYARLVELQSLAENWDHEGAPPVSTEALQTAVHLIQQMHEAGIAVEDISPDVMGGLEIDMYHDDQGASIMIPNHGDWCLLGTRPGSGVLALPTGESLAWSPKTSHLIPTGPNWILNLQAFLYNSFEPEPEPEPGVVQEP